MSEFKYINVIEDNGGAYGGRVSVSALINDYISGLNEEEDSDCIEWLKDNSYDVEEKLLFITSVWGIDFEIV